MSNLLGRLVNTKTVDGVRLDGFLSTPRQNDSAVTGGTAWIICHGVNGNFYGSSLLSEIAEAVDQLGQTSLLVNTRGHDIAAFNGADLPMRLGSQFETVSHCSHDLDAWMGYLRGEGYESVGVIGHSLGAVKVAYWAAEAERAGLRAVICISPPRLSSRILLNDPKRSEVFAAQMATARKLCEEGRPDEVMKVRFPLPTWICASTYIDKYGHDEKYDYLEKAPKIRVPVLWLFGESEVLHGSSNFFGADERLAKRLDEIRIGRSEFDQMVLTIAGADHSYRGTRKELLEPMKEWITLRRLAR